VRPAAMNSTPSLSVVILTFNSDATIGHCLESLIQQEYRDFEVVVVDDNSTDDTLSVVQGYADRLRLKVTKNGTHIIPRGRNIGIASSSTDLVAFLDSDDSVAPEWTRAIVETFREYPETALISGVALPAYRTRTAHAIALNDHAVRRLFARGVALFYAGNCAINLRVIKDVRFDEDFKFAEDLELWARVQRRYRWKYVPNMQIYYYSKETFRQYATQMYRYGFMKGYYSFTFKSYRLVDFVPLGLMAGCVIASLTLQSWRFLLLIILFSLAEALFVVFFERCPAKVALLTFPAWLVKNVAWSVGIGHGFVALAMDGDTRRLLRSKRAGSV
jgi:glycosyltransferase involved in cell wall biosynthesis